MHLLPKEGIYQDRTKVVMMTKEQIAELQKQVKKLESQVEVLMNYQQAIEPLIKRVRDLEWKMRETRDSLDRAADLLDVPRSRI